MQKVKVEFHEVRETMLLTLLAKARESGHRNSLLNDHHAAAALEQIDYDFRRLRPRREADVIIALRASIFDGLTRQFLTRNPDCTVVHMACGLDTRVFRIEPGPGVRWFDVDFPDTVALRERLYPTRPGYELVATDLTNLDWIARIPNDRPTLVIAEGLTYYLEPAAGLALFRALSERFPRMDLVIDIFSRLGCWLAMREGTVAKTGARLIWGIDNPAEIAAAVPALALAEDLHGYHPELQRMGWNSDWFFRLVHKVPAIAEMSRIVRYTQG